MNILVCIKQVPDGMELRLDPAADTLVRESVPSAINPFDCYALEAAASIKGQDPDTRIVALSMGPRQAEAALREALSIAADKAYLVTDPIFSGSDTLATSYILYHAISKVEALEGTKFDAVFCGRQAIDGNTAQVGPQLAERLNYPQVTCALEAINADGTLHVLKESEEGACLIGVKTPCLITFTQPSHDLPAPDVQGERAAGKAAIQILTAADLPAIDPDRAGRKGSPTQVKQTAVSPRRRAGTIIRGATGTSSAHKLFALLSQAHVI